MKHVLIFLILFFCAPLFAQSSGAAKSPNSVPGLIYQEDAKGLLIKPPEKHHFNLKAPLSVKAQGKALSFDKSEDQVLVKLPKDAKEIEVQSYVCDQGNTYCLFKKETYHPGEKSGKAATVGRAQSQKMIGYFDKASGFWVNSPEAAMQEAQKSKKALMVDFYGIWCPPCNQMDNLVFDTTDFKKVSKNLVVKLKMDSDQPLAQELMEKYSIKYFPTYIFLNNKNEELFRVVGSREKAVFMNFLKQADSMKDTSLEELKEAAKKGDNSAVEKMAKWHADREEFDLVVGYLSPKRSDLLKAKSQLMENLFQAEYQTAKDSKAKIAVLTEWNKNFPGSPQMVSFFSDWIELVKESKDEAELKRVAKMAISKVQSFVDQPVEKIAQYDLTKGDLFMTIAGLAQEIKDDATTTAAYHNCIKYYDEEIARIKGFSRGSELNRAYCLRKSDGVEKAVQIYETGIKKYPEDFTFYFGLGRLQMDDKKDLPTAIETLKKALTKAYGSQRVRVSLVLSKAYEKAGRTPEAIEMIKTEITSGTDIFSSQQKTRLEKRVAELEGADKTQKK